MLPDIVFDLLIFVPFGLMAIVFIYIGLQGILKQQPYIYSARLVVWPFTISIAAIAIAMISLQFSPFSDGIDFLVVFQILMFGILLFVVWRQMQGYIVMGVTEAMFRDALIKALDDAGISHKESVSGFALDDLDDILHVNIQDWMGTAQLRMKSKNNRDYLERLIGVLKPLLLSVSGDTKMISSVIFGVTGLLMLVFGVYLILDL